MTPRYQHTADELREVSKIMDALEAFSGKDNSIGIFGELEVFWCDRVMGRIMRDQTLEEDGPWVYFPEADPDRTTTDNEPTATGEAK